MNVLFLQPPVEIVDRLGSSSFSMLTFTVSKHGIGNSPIVPDQQGLLSFTIQTDRNIFQDCKQTSLTTSGPGEEPNALSGRIDWKNKMIGVNGVMKPFAEVKRKVGGIF